MPTEQAEFEQAAGTTESERYLAGLCRRTFLSLWSFPNPFRAKNRELCDLLVVCGNRVLIFSDKSCDYKNTSRIDTDWSRWRRRAIEDSVRQIHGAERHLRRDPQAVFIDSGCTIPLPWKLPEQDDIRIYRIAVAVGAGAHAAKFHNMPGHSSMMLLSWHLRKELGDMPFSFMHANQACDFIHVLDEVTLDLLLGTLDTISDFIAYLDFKERYFLRPYPTTAAGDDELLGFYLLATSRVEDPLPVLDEKVMSESISLVEVGQGHWAEFLRSPRAEILRQIRSAGAQFDWIIEMFARNLVERNVSVETEGTFVDHERIIRILALENRVSRAAIGHAIDTKRKKTPRDVWSAAVIPSKCQAGLRYVLLLLPYESGNYHDYRRERAAMAYGYGLVVRLLQPDVKVVVVLAAEPGESRSETLAALDVSNWTTEIESRARFLHRECGFLSNTTMKSISAIEEVTE